MLKRFLVAITALFLPLAPTLAATPLTFKQIVNDHIVTFVDTAIVPLLYILAFLFFLVGIVRYFFTGGAENREVGRTYVIWSLIGMVIIFSVWSIVHLLLSAIGS